MLIKNLLLAFFLSQLTLLGCSTIVMSGEKIRAMVKQAENYYLEKISYRSGIELSCPQSKVSTRSIARRQQLLNLGPPTSIGNYAILRTVEMQGCGRKMKYQISCEDDRVYVFKSPKCNYGEHCKPCAILHSS